MQQLILNLKQNNEDFEFYPTSKEMVKCIYERMDYANVLDIGCGICNFKKYFDEFSKQDSLAYEKWLTSDRKNPMPKTKKINKYFVIEKSQILLQKLDKDAIVLGTDFNSTMLMDKAVDVYFCNPPYSEYAEWTCKIIREGNFKKAYLIIPKRWVNNEAINNTIKNAKVTVNVIGEFDFLHAERQARAVVNIIVIKKDDSYRELKDFETNSFNTWFDETFKMRDSQKDNKYEWDIEQEEIKKVKNEIVNSQSKAQVLVDLYNNEQKTLFEHFKAISSLDIDILNTIGIKKEAVKEALKQKVKSLKIRYWKIVFDEFEEITERLTSETRRSLFDKFKELQTVDFTIENIYPLILWVIKNSNNYYETQLIDFFKKLSSPENVKQYKSNKKVFELDKWRHNCFEYPDKISHYVLDYRIIMSSPFKVDWHGRLETAFDTKVRLQDIFIIARNLGFEIGECKLPCCFGEEVEILYKNSNKVFMKYRAYKNGNMHVKFDIEFAKAMNVEISRLLGWIRDKEEIAKEFPDNMADASKYFKINNYISLENNKLLLGVNYEN